MNFQQQQQVKDHGRKPHHFVNWTGTVLPVPFSHKEPCIGVHWLRISMPLKHLAKVADFCSKLWGDNQADEYGLWSYTDRLAWSSGVSLNYDQDHDRCYRVHAGMMTLDCPGGSLDELSSPDLQLLLEFCNAYNGKCTRIDVFFDDYNRTVTPMEVYQIAVKGDYSGFRCYSRRERGNREGITHDEIAFGRRGSFGSGAYLRFYDKNMESNGDQDCCRWEVEFTQRKADKVFKVLAETCGNIQAFSTLCGSLIAGCITFVHRTGEKNISRLERYDWWEIICEILGDSVRVRIERKKDSVTGKMQWIERNVSPSLACLMKIFASKRDFFRWLFDVTHAGAPRMNPFSEQIARENEGSLRYAWGEFDDQNEVTYDKTVSQL